jgi:uridine kinase
MCHWDWENMENKPIMQPLIVAIVGGSGSGKTWIAKKLKRSLGSCAGVLSMDDFYRDLSSLPVSERTKVNFDHPSAIDWTLLTECLKQIQRNERALIPRYDFASHTRGAGLRVWRRKSVVLIDGLWLLRRSELRRNYSFSVFVDCPDKVRLARRIARDVRERGRAEASVRSQFQQCVQPMHSRFVQPQRTRAAFVVASPLSETKFEDLLKALRAALKKTTSAIP